MAGNVNPIFSRVGHLGWTTGGAITAAANDLTGVSTNNVVLWQADTLTGGYVQGVQWKHAGTNVATVGRIYANNSSGTTVAGNNVLIAEQNLPAITASTAAAQIGPYTPINMAFNPAYRVVVGLGTSVAGGWFPTVIGGKY